MCRFFYVVLFIIIHSFGVTAMQSAALLGNTDEYQLSGEQLGKIPFLHHHDAREFFTVMKPVFVEYNKKRKLEKRNPYVVCFETMIFGETFCLMDQGEIDENFRVVLPKLIHTAEDFRHWTEVTTLTEDSDVYQYLSQHTLNSVQKKKQKNTPGNYQNYAIPARFGDAVRMLDGNIFSSYWLGLMQYELEQSSNLVRSQEYRKMSLKKIVPVSAIHYLTYAADGFCELALDFLSAIKMNDSGRELGDKKRKLEKIYRAMSCNNQDDTFAALNTFITNIVQDNIFSGQRMFLLDLNGSLLPIDNMKKLISSLIFDGSPFQKSYQECYDALYGKISAERNKSFFSTEDFMWRFTTFGFPLIMMGLNGGLVYYAEEDAHSKSFKDNFTLLAPKGLLAISAAFMTFNFGAYAMYKRPVFIRLSEDILKDEIKLISLYLASNPSEQESNKSRVEEIFNTLYRTAVGFSFGPLPSMSEIAIDYEENKE